MKKYTIEQTETTYEIFCGQNAQENWDIISDSEQNDIWFHLEDNPSPHVVLKTQGKKMCNIDKKIIYYCACVCKENSKFAKMNTVKMIYTEIKNVTKGEEVGSVHTKKVKKMKV
uniref:NFACT RNA-binding domain-containing protein n=1 Tax=viral metagenome TaxID=1070528 RepID=A0A6C0EBF0_9ZZZZ